MSTTLDSKRIRGIIAISVLSATLIFGYIYFLVSSVSVYMITKYLSAKETAQSSKIPSIVLPMAKYRLHLHHWLIASAGMAVVLIRGPWFFPSDLVYGVLSGIAFHGVHCYDDWHKIIILKQGKRVRCMSESPDQSRAASPARYELALSVGEAKLGTTKILSRQGKKLEVSIAAGVATGRTAELTNAL
jgi:hypothetical protein